MQNIGDPKLQATKDAASKRTQTTETAENISMFKWLQQKRMKNLSERNQSLQDGRRIMSCRNVCVKIRSIRRYVKMTFSLGKNRFGNQRGHECVSEEISVCV